MVLLMKKVFYTVLCCGLCAITACLGWPEAAFAWGPGAHMVTGNWVLQNLNVLPAHVAMVLMQFPGQFLHGILSADIFIGKGRQIRGKNHSHDWRGGFALLERARNGAGRGKPRKADGKAEGRAGGVSPGAALFPVPEAFCGAGAHEVHSTTAMARCAYAYGYLAHLAADTVAHNAFVPGLFHTMPGGGRMTHIYLEIQADRLLSWDKGDALAVFKEKESARTAALLRASMRQQVLPFWIKTHLFQGSVAVGGSRMWRESMRLLDKMIALRERRSLVENMLSLSTKAMIDLLQKGENSAVLSLDPMGTDAPVRCAQGGAKIFTLELSRQLLGPLSGFARASGREARLDIVVPNVLQELLPICGPGETALTEKELLPARDRPAASENTA